jgi:flagellar biosynthesis component FlhA
MDDILNALQGMVLSPATIGQGIHAVRLALKPFLPGNQLDTQRVELPAELEERLLLWVSPRGGPPDTHPRLEQWQDVLATISDILPAEPAPVVLVTRSSKLRPFVRRLVESRFPDLMVLSQAELLTREEIMASQALTDVQI